MRKIDIEAQKNFDGDTLKLIRHYAENRISVSEFVGEMTHEEKVEVMRAVVEIGAKKYGSREEFENAVLKDIKLEEMGLSEDEVLNTEKNPYKKKILIGILEIVVLEGAIFCAAYFGRNYGINPATVGGAAQVITAVLATGLAGNIINFFKFKKLKKMVVHTHEIEQGFKTDDQDGEDTEQ